MHIGTPNNKVKPGLKHNGLFFWTIVTLFISLNFQSPLHWMFLIERKGYHWLMISVSQHPREMWFSVYHHGAIVRWPDVGRLPDSVVFYNGMKPSSRGASPGRR